MGAIAPLAPVSRFGCPVAACWCCWCWCWWFLPPPVRPTSPCLCRCRFVGDCRCWSGDGPAASSELPLAFASPTDASLRDATSCCRWCRWRGCGGSGGDGEGDGCGRDGRFASGFRGGGGDDSGGAGGGCDSTSGCFVPTSDGLKV